MKIVFFGVCAALVLISWYRFRGIINPLSAHTISFALQIAIYFLVSMLADALGLHLVALFDEERILSYYMVAVLGFALGWVGKPSRQPFIRTPASFDRIEIQRNLAFLMQMEIAGIAVIAMVMFAIVGFPLMSMIHGTYDIQALNDAVEALPFGILGVLVWLTLVLSLHWVTGRWLNIDRAWPIKPALMWFALLAVVFASVFYGKRQSLLMLLFFYATLYAASLNNMFKVIRGVVFIGGLFAAFFLLYIGIQFVRTQGAGDGDGNVFFMELFLSAIWPILNFSAVVDAGLISHRFHGLVSQIVPNRLLGHGTEDIKDLLFEPTASTSYVQYAFMDFGVIGIFFAALFFALLSRLFCSVKTNWVSETGVKLMVLWCCMTSSVYSHGFSNNYFLFPIVLLIFAGVGFGRIALMKTPTSRMVQQ